MYSLGAGANLVYADVWEACMFHMQQMTITVLNARFGCHAYFPPSLRFQTLFKSCEEQPVSGTGWVSLNQLKLQVAYYWLVENLK